MPTEIQWTDETWNPTTGCTKVSPGCARCYITRTPAFRIAGRKFVKGATDFRLHPDRLEKPLHWKKPRRVFVNSLSDLFHEDVPDAFIDRVFAVMALAPQHTFQILTKRPQRMRAYIRAKADVSDPVVVLDGVYADAIQCAMDDAPRGWKLTGAPYKWPLPNVWIGGSVENQHFADERIPLLLQTPAAVRFISAEPLLGPLILTPWLKFFRNDHIDDPTGVAYNSLDWVIVGGESGPGARPCNVDWLRAIIEQCRLEGVACFVKQIGSRPRWGAYGPDSGTAAEARAAGGLSDSKGGDIAEWPADLQIREFPSYARA